MGTYREFISKITNLLKSNNKDEYIPKRFILSVLKDTAMQLISQKWMDRTILQESNLFTTINCFEFERIDSKKCNIVEFRFCKTLMKSKEPLPKLVFSRLGASIKEIYSLDGEYKFVFVDKAQYARNKKRQYKLKNEVYIYLDTDNHLYIPDQEIYSVDLVVITLNPEDVKDCKEKECKSNWDFEFIVPDKLKDVIFTQALQILGISKQIREDENPNNVAGK